VGKHLLDETAEFKMPRFGRHASPETGELDMTQRLELASQPGPAPRPDRDLKAR